jgi:hypothetical protein
MTKLIRIAEHIRAAARATSNDKAPDWIHMMDHDDSQSEAHRADLAENRYSQALWSVWGAMHRVAPPAATGPEDLSPRLHFEDTVETVRWPRPYQPGLFE